MDDITSPKYSVGDTVSANWAGGHTTMHVITSIKRTERGFWYTWKDDGRNCGNGLHEHHLNMMHSKK
ncbi:hypothetical protein BC351_00510 [Paenibacillus ferrarius]|uniref:Uncharacterized protein n=1 Tax=Paenibacillus ferrarius TaxID=1469647 RepID=A0A1V4HSJ8_9BACL|nr:hypothetical protein [Paenibacillus ferrarius]OPH61758.1 hypothetical protein BC351_00510 [Paenibacillus ferrarius]